MNSLSFEEDEEESHGLLILARPFNPLGLVQLDAKDTLACGKLIFPIQATGRAFFSCWAGQQRVTKTSWGGRKRTN